MSIERTREILTRLADPSIAHPVRSPGVVSMAQEALDELEDRGHQPDNPEVRRAALDNRNQ